MCCPPRCLEGGAIASWILGLGPRAGAACARARADEGARQSVKGLKCREIGKQWLLEVDLEEECPWLHPTSITFIWTIISVLVYPIGETWNPHIMIDTSRTVRSNLTGTWWACAGHGQASRCSPTGSCARRVSPSWRWRRKSTPSSTSSLSRSVSPPHSSSSSCVCLVPAALFLSWAAAS